MLTLILKFLIFIFFCLCLLQVIKLMSLITNNNYDEDKDPESHGKIYKGNKEISSEEFIAIIEKEYKK